MSDVRHWIGGVLHDHGRDERPGCEAHMVGLCIVNPAARLAAQGVTVGLDVETFRAEFLRLLTTDSETKDRRRKDFNQAIFDAERGYAIWSSTDLDMVMEKFDRAARAALATPQPAEEMPATFPLDVDAFLAGIDSPWHSPASREAWVRLFYRDMRTALHAATPQPAEEEE